jgi:tektin-2
VKGSVTPETWDQFSNYNKLRAEAEMQASQRLREAIFATIQKTANDLEAQRQATEFSYRKRIHETEQTKNELEWQQRNVSLFHTIIIGQSSQSMKSGELLTS